MINVRKKSVHIKLEPAMMNVRKKSELILIAVSVVSFRGVHKGGGMGAQLASHTPPWSVKSMVLIGFSGPNGC